MPPIDQLPGTRWFPIIGPIDNTAGTFYLQCNSADHIAYPAQCPVAGQQFTGFTRSGVPIVNEFNDQAKYRPAYDPGPNNGYVDWNYVSYGAADEYAGTILGYDMSAAINDWNTRVGNAQLAGFVYGNGYPSKWWDPTVVVPGVPAVVTYSNQFNNTLACASAPGTVVSSLGLIQGNGGSTGAWSVLPTSSDTTHFAISGNNPRHRGQPAVQRLSGYPGADDADRRRDGHWANQLAHRAMTLDAMTFTTVIIPTMWLAVIAEASRNSNAEAPARWGLDMFPESWQTAPLWRRFIGRAPVKAGAADCQKQKVLISALPVGKLPRSWMICGSCDLGSRPLW